MKRGYDSSVPVKDAPNWYVCGFYMGGMTPHIWTDAEIAAITARELNPIYPYIGVDSAAEAARVASEMLARAIELKLPKGKSLCIDTETNVYNAFLVTLDHMITVGGYSLLNYGSLAYVIQNAPTSGGRWSADWTDVQHIDDGHNIVGTQFASSTQLGTDYDASVFDDSVPFAPNPNFVLPVKDAIDQSLKLIDSASAGLLQAHSLLKPYA